jgi:CRISPR-associated protein Cas5d
MKGKSHIIEVWGDFACFSRPESKVERYSYPVITPSAARNIFDAIYWKPEENFYWQIESIEVLSEPRYLALRRNEVKDKAPNHGTILQWADGKKTIEPIWADGDKGLLGTDQKGRTQRQTMALKNVRYRLHAHMRFRNVGANIQSRDAQFVRRARQGKCIYQPYLGCREFPAYFELVQLHDSAQLTPPINKSFDLGWMLYDVFDLSKANSSDAVAKISLFNARIENGVLHVPAYEQDAVHKEGDI